MSVFRFLAITILCLINVGIANAQAHFVTTISASKIGKNEMLEVTYEVQNGSIENFFQPTFSEWQLVGGPTVSSSTFISNGEKTTSMSYQFVLKPIRPGLFTIPGARAVVDGKLMQSNNVTITVSNKNTNNPQPPPSTTLPDPLFMMPPELTPPQNIYEDYDGYLLKDNENILEKTKSNLFIQVDVSKKTCYPGEAVKAVYKLYSRVNMDAHITKRPSFSGFSSIDLPDSTNREYEIVTRNGKQFKMYTIRGVQLYPLQTGMQTLEPAEIEATVQYKKAPSAQSLVPYDEYDPSNNISYPFTVKSEPVTVNVLPFPEEGKPADFNGVTGSFKIAASIVQKELAKNEAGTLRLEINGGGNWAMIQTPEIKWPAGADVYEPVITESLDSQAVPVSGKRVYEFPFSKAKPGKLIIPPISITFFDPLTKAYKEEKTQPLSVEILNKNMPVNKPAENTYNNFSGADNTQIFTDIVKIAFPIAAVLLVLALIIKGRRKRVYNTQQAYYRKQYQSIADRNKEQLVIENFQRFTPASKTATTALADPEIPVKESHSLSTTDNILSEKTTAPNEHAGYPPISARTYFTGVKKDILALLLKHYSVEEQPLSITKRKLLENGMSVEETEKIIDMLALCEQHIYSLFSEDFDTAKCDESVAEINAIVSRNK
jgi:hypothetical protein